MTTPEWKLHGGTGDWRYFPIERLDDVYAAAEGWKSQLDGVDRPWLCWCVDDDWCTVQQRLVKACGWTPVVGTDGKIKNPSLESDSIFIDFNHGFDFELMKMHFPLEFVHRYCEKLAFWHSDVLIPVSVMQKAADQFAKIRDGSHIAVFERPGLGISLTRLKKLVTAKTLNRKHHWFRNFRAARWFEVIGCTTSGATLDMHTNGCGFWRYIDRHPNYNQNMIGPTPFYEYGAGVWYWQRNFQGDVEKVCVDVEPYHHTTYGIKRGDSRGVQRKGEILASTVDLNSLVPDLEL